MIETCVCHKKYLKADTVKLITVLFLILLFPWRNSFAREVKFRKKISPGALQVDLVAAGFSVNYIDCSQDNCIIHLSDKEKKDPMPIVNRYVYVDPVLVRKQKMDSMKALYAKWQAGTITPAEKDELLKQLAAFVLGIPN